MRGMSIRSKLLFVIGVMVVVIVGLLAVMTRTTHATKSQYTRLSEIVVPLVRSLEEVRFAASQVDALASSYLAAVAAVDHQQRSARSVAMPPDTGEAMRLSRVARSAGGEMLRAVTELEIAIGDWSRLLDDAKGRIDFGSGAERSKIVAAGDAFVETVLSIGMIDLTTQPATSVLAAGRAVWPHKWALLSAADEAIQQYAAELDQVGRNVDMLLDSSVEYAILFSFLGLLVAVACGSFLVRSVVSPIHNLRDAALRVGSGDFKALPRKTTDDEIGQLVDAFNDMAGRLECDIAARERVELDLRQTLDELKTATDRLGRQERLSVLGQVAGTVSHELRNPLGSIRNSMGLIRQQTSGKGLGIERAIDRVDRSIERCSTIIADLLEFTRVRELARELTAIDGWVEEVLAEQTIPASVEIRRELSSGAELMIDRNRLRQVVINLVDNAVQAMTDPAWSPPGDRARMLTLRTELAGPHVRLSVIDSGPGIPPDMRERVFEPLVTTKSSGVGLGLPTVRQIVEQHGGTIDIGSSSGEGTTFVAWLPRHAVRQPDQTAQKEHAA